MPGYADGVETFDRAENRGMKMHKVALLFSVLVILAAPARAQVTCRTAGNMVHCVGPNGYVSDTRVMGNQTEYRSNSYAPPPTSTCRIIGNLMRCD
jgi:hypothetical protein